MEPVVDLRKKSEPAGPGLEPKVEGIRWTVHHRPLSKSRAARVAAALVTGAAAVAYFHLGYLFAMFLALAAALLILLSFKKPESHQTTVDAAGIIINGKRYFYRQICSFWLNYEPPHEKELIIILRKRFAPMIRIHLGDADHLEIRKIMVSLVPETEHEDSLLDQIVKKLTG